MSKLYNDLPFLSGRMKIGKVEKLVANLYDKKEYVIHIGNLKLSLNHRLELIKHGDIKLETTKKKKKTNCWLSEPNYQTILFLEYSLAIEMKINTNVPK